MEAKRLIKKQIEYLQEVKENLRKYTRENKENPDCENMIWACKGQIIEINRNIEFLNKINNAIDDDERAIIKFINEQL